MPARFFKLYIIVAFIAIPPLPLSSIRTVALVFTAPQRQHHRQILLTCFACTVLVAEFYLCSQSDSCVDLPLWIVSSEIFYSVFFVLDYLLYFYAASDRLAHFRDLHNLVDLLTILPVFALLPAFSAMSTTSNGFVAGRFLRALRAVRALRIIRAYRVLSLTSTGVRRQVMVIAFSILRYVIYIV